MKKYIPVLLLVLTLPVLAKDMVEEGIVLNQELQFLVDSAKTPNIRNSQAKSPIADSDALPKIERNLEKTYFGDEDDSVSTRAAGRRRRETTD